MQLTLSHLRQLPHSLMPRSQRTDQQKLPCLSAVRCVAQKNLSKVWMPNWTQNAQLREGKILTTASDKRFLTLSNNPHVMLIQWFNLGFWLQLRFVIYLDESLRTSKKTEKNLPRKIDDHMMTVPWVQQHQDLSQTNTMLLDNKLISKVETFQLAILKSSQCSVQ